MMDQKQLAKLVSGLKNGTLAWMKSTEVPVYGETYMGQDIHGQMVEKAPVLRYRYNVVPMSDDDVSLHQGAGHNLQVLSVDDVLEMLANDQVQNQAAVRTILRELGHDV